VTLIKSHLKPSSEEYRTNHAHNLALCEDLERRKDLLRQGGARPLNLSRRSGEAVQVVLADPQGEWTAGAPAMSVSWYW